MKQTHAQPNGGQNITRPFFRVSYRGDRASDKMLDARYVEALFAVDGVSYLRLGDGEKLCKKEKFFKKCSRIERRRLVRLV